MKELRTEITIEAPADKIWKVFTDLKKYPEWSSFIEKIEGTMKKGEKMNIHLKTPKGQEMDIKPEVLENIPDEEFRWLGHFGGVKFLFNGEHYFQLVPVDDTKTRFIQGERFSGISIPMLWKGLDTDTRAGFKEFNEALKKRVESS